MSSSVSTMGFISLPEIWVSDKDSRERRTRPQWLRPGVGESWRCPFTDCAADQAGIIGRWPGLACRWAGLRARLGPTGRRALGTALRRPLGGLALRRGPALRRALGACFGSAIRPGLILRLADLDRRPRGCSLGPRRPRLIARPGRLDRPIGGKGGRIGRATPTRRSDRLGTRACTGCTCCPAERRGSGGRASLRPGTISMPGDGVSTRRRPASGCCLPAPGVATSPEARVAFARRLAAADRAVTDAASGCPRRRDAACAADIGAPNPTVIGHPTSPPAWAATVVVRRSR